MTAKQYRDMTDAERLAWGIEESLLRQRDLSGVNSADALRTAQEKAQQRRKAIGATRGQATSMVIEANRDMRRARSTP